MNLFTGIIPKTPRSDEMPEIPELKIPRGFHKRLQWECDLHNSRKGDLQGYDCPECLNRGFFFEVVKEDYIVRRECRCMNIRNSPLRLDISGLKDLRDFDRFTFEIYEAKDEWQKRAKSTAMEYITENDGKWLFFGGQSGVGKTHLCTAVCKEFILQGYDVKYVLWRDILRYFNANRFDYDKYGEKMESLQNVDILYMDDFLKTTDKKQLENDMNYAYEIINSRSFSKKLTIISSEMWVNEIIALDEATGTRIHEMSDGFQIQIKRAKNRNYRIYGKE